MATSYSYTYLTLSDYITSLYTKGFGLSENFTDQAIQNFINEIGLFKIKGYVKAFRNHANKNIDDVIISYFFDKFFSRIIFDLSTRLETKIKTFLIEECYQRTSNPFFYLIQNNHKIPNFNIDFPTYKNWETPASTSTSESYAHYQTYYMGEYNFSSNLRRYLHGATLITTFPNINYPPFHYLIESATLGCTIGFIRSIKLTTHDISQILAHKFILCRDSSRFINYLERLQEIRNRTAHNGRIYNRNFRSVSGFGYYSQLRRSIDQHKSLDIYMFLLYSLGHLNSVRNFSDFESEFVNKLFSDFETDFISTHYLGENIKTLKNWNLLKGELYKMMK